jgi:hypothetical protein
MIVVHKFSTLSALTISAIPAIHLGITDIANVSGIVASTTDVIVDGIL